MGAAKGKGHTLTTQYLSICVWQSSGQPQAFALARQVSWWHSKCFLKSIQAELHTTVFLQVRWPAGIFPTTRNRNFGSEANKKCISTYNMKIQKIHQKQKLSKSTSSKTEVALLSLHSVLKWLLVCIVKSLFTWLTGAACWYINST